jgi:hypothetical protein
MMQNPMRLLLSKNNLSCQYVQQYFSFRCREALRNDMEYYGMIGKMRNVCEGRLVRVGHPNLGASLHRADPQMSLPTGTWPGHNVSCHAKRGKLVNVLYRKFSYIIRPYKTNDTCEYTKYRKMIHSKNLKRFWRKLVQKQLGQ